MIKLLNGKSNFPIVFENGGFDVVIGNPPYVSKTFDDATKKYINEKFESAEYQLDLYVSFLEKAVSIS